MIDGVIRNQVLILSFSVPNSLSYFGIPGINLYSSLYWPCY